MKQVGIALRLETGQTINGLKKVDAQAKKFNGTINKQGSKLKVVQGGLKGTALGFLGIGGAAKAATPGIAGAGMALHAALAPILPLIAAGAALQQMFGTLVKQDFGEAKFETLGGNSEDLVHQLKMVSAELNNQISVTELTSASYDVASAGFSKAAEAAQVLKAASQGATGGFADLNTTGNALTSVLNAYGASASESRKIMDQFIQTQNDGKIVVSEYADNIGKVASVAATLNVPLSEVNAIIAQSTAAGVKAETAFTGLKVSMLKLVSSRGQKKLKDFGVDISATTIEAEGLAANLEKLSGMGTQALTDIFGAEAIQVMAPILKDMERYRELVESQEKANGVAARAAFTASDTLQGQIKRLGVSFQNIFAEGSEAGEILKQTIRALAIGIDLLAVAVKLVAAPFRAVFQVIKGISSAIGEAFGIEQINIIQDFEKAWANSFIDLERRLQRAMAASKLYGRNLVIAMKNAFIDIQNSMPAWAKRMFGVSAEPISRLQFETLDESQFEPETFKKNKEEKQEANKKAEASLKKQIELTKYLDEGFKQVGVTISQSLAQGIKGLIKGTQSLGEMLGNIANKIQDMLIDMAIGAAFKYFGLPGFAAGGKPPVGKPALVGERGPELFVPRQAGTIIPNNQLGGGGSVNVSVNVDASGSSVEGEGDQAAQLGNMIGAAIQAELVRQKRPGGLLAV
jgi:TP901 family phage tail tape measure protein